MLSANLCFQAVGKLGEVNKRCVPMAALGRALEGGLKNQKGGGALVQDPKCVTAHRHLDKTALDLLGGPP